MAPAMQQIDSASDDLEELFNYDMNMDDIINSGSQTNGMNGISEAKQDGETTDTAKALGIDEEIKVSKKRKPAPKLDETR
jgi:replication fork protection complex subunit Csm3/Swi3